MHSACETLHTFRVLRKKGRMHYERVKTDHDPFILDAIARAMHWQALLEAGIYRSVRELADAEGLMPTTVGRLLRLARLAPDIVEQFMRGCQPRRLTLLWLMRNDIPALWTEQRLMLERFR